jgi:acid phosphatase type 7
MKKPSLALLVTAALVAVPIVLVPAQATARPAPARSTATDPVIAAVGDIACKNAPGNNRKVCQYDDVARLVERGDYDAFLPLGDIQYEKGAYADFRDNYDAYFHDLLPITEPIPGNHDYGVTGANGYYRYFGAAGHGPDGYYSYDLGSWHLIALNSAVCSPVTGCGPGDPQYEWLQADLAADHAQCTLAYWHHPRYDWLNYQKANWVEDYEFLRTKPFWDLLYDAGADVVLSGHNHNYSRWLPMDKDLQYDPDGIVQFISGAGGRNLDGLGSKNVRPSTFATGQGSQFGVLQLALHPDSYDFRFRSTLGARSDYVDAGRNVACH